MILLYDNTFEGLLTAVFEAFRLKQTDGEIVAEKHFVQQSLFEIVNISSDSEKAQRVLAALKQKISARFLNDVYCLYLSDTLESGTIVLRYVIMGLQHGKKVYNFNCQNDVNRAQMLVSKVLFENHRFKGFVRFKQFKDVFLSDIAPDYNILPVLYKHFDRRLPNQNWIIRDMRRNIAAVHFETKTNICLCEACPIEITDEYEEMWCAFYKAIAIKQRTNPRLQRSFMPQRYWVNIVETQH